MGDSQEVVTTDTNYAQHRCTNSTEALTVGEGMRFPSHLLIVRPSGNPDPTLIRKGIRDAETLRLAVQQAIATGPREHQHRMGAQLALATPHRRPPRPWPQSKSERG